MHVDEWQIFAAIPNKRKKESQLISFPGFDAAHQSLLNFCDQ